MRKLRCLTVIGLTDFFTLAHVVSQEFKEDRKTYMETFAVAKQDEGMLRMSCDKFAVENAQQTDFLLREFLELNRD